MARNTSINLGDHFNAFIDTQIQDGRYGSVSEVVRAALRLMEDRETKLSTLRAKLLASEIQANNGQFANYSLDGLIEELDHEDTA